MTVVAWWADHAERPEAHGAVGDGVTDDTAAIMAADDVARSRGTFVQFGPRVYRCHLTWRSGADWRGAGLKGSTHEHSTVLRGPSGTPTVTLDAEAVVYNARMENLRIESGGGGAAALLKTDQEQHDSLSFDRVALVSYTGPGIGVTGGISGVTLRDSYVYGHPYGIDLDIPTTHGAAMDWWEIERGQLGGSQGGLRFRATNAGGHNWRLSRVRFNGGAGHTIWIHAWTKNWAWQNVVASEAQGGGIWGASSTFTTTATANSGQNTATLAAVSGVAIGQKLMIRGADATGNTYNGNITGIAGNIVTLDTAIGTSVTAADCTNAEFDILHVGTGAEATAAGQPYIGEPIRHIFMNCDMGRGAGSIIRYSVSGGGRCLYVNHESYGAPVQDNYGGNIYIDSSAPVWRSNIQAAAAEFPVGHYVWSKTLTKPVWSDGTNWRDGAGNIVTP